MSVTMTSMSTLIVFARYEQKHGATTGGVCVGLIMSRVARKTCVASRPRACSSLREGVASCGRLKDYVTTVVINVKRFGIAYAPVREGCELRGPFARRRETRRRSGRLTAFRTRVAACGWFVCFARVDMWFGERDDRRENPRRLGRGGGNVGWEICRSWFSFSKPSEIDFSPFRHLACICVSWAVRTVREYVSWRETAPY